MSINPINTSIVPNFQPLNNSDINPLNSNEVSDRVNSQLAAMTEGPVENLVPISSNNADELGLLAIGKLSLGLSRENIDNEIAQLRSINNIESQIWLKLIDAFFSRDNLDDFTHNEIYKTNLIIYATHNSLNLDSSFEVREDDSIEASALAVFFALNLPYHYLFALLATIKESSRANIDPEYPLEAFKNLLETESSTQILEKHNLIDEGYNFLTTRVKNCVLKFYIDLGLDKIYILQNSDEDEQQVLPFIRAMKEKALEYLRTSQINISLNPKLKDKLQALIEFVDRPRA